MFEARREKEISSSLARVSEDTFFLLDSNLDCRYPSHTHTYTHADFHPHMEYRWWYTLLARHDLLQERHEGR